MEENAGVIYLRGEDGKFHPVHTLMGAAPVRGQDYWTEADKQEIVREVLAQLGRGTA